MSNNELLLYESLKTDLEKLKKEDLPKIDKQIIINRLERFVNLVFNKD